MKSAMTLLERMVSRIDWWGKDMVEQDPETAEPIFDQSGRVVGWLYNQVIFDTDKRYRARIRNGAVYSFTAMYLGQLDRGFFRDRAGLAVAFLSDAEGEPVLPRCEAAPMPIGLPTAPVPPLPSSSPIHATPRGDWSSLTWDEFLRARSSKPS